MEANGWRLTTIDDRVVWRGAKDKYPSAKALNDILSQDVTTEQLVDYTIQAVRFCPTRALPNLLSYFACSCWASEGTVDIKKLFTLANANKRSLCGKPVKKGDIMWICRQCGKDPTCVQCDDCFQNSDHDGHEVYFYRSSASGGGGCCDCGDPEAWQDGGNCCNHGSDHTSRSIDPVSAIPAELLTTLDAVITGVLLIFLNVITTEINGFNAPAADASSLLPEEVTVRLHNDDLHTFDDVSTALISTGLSQSVAAALTMSVDQEGSAAVIRTCNKAEVMRAWDLLGNKAALLISAVPTTAASMDDNLAAAWSWLLQLAGSNDGLMRHLTVRLLENTDSLCAFIESSDRDDDDDDDDDDDTMSVPGFVATNSGADLSTSSGGGDRHRLLQKHLPGPLQAFPSHLPLRPGGTYPGSPPAPGARDRHRGVVVMPAGADGASLVDMVLVTKLTPFGPSKGTYAQQEEAVAYAPHVLLAVLLVCSPYLSKAIQKGLHDAVILMQQDVLFKMGFSQLLVHVYPTLSVLFFHGIGTHNDTIFTSSVQVFTSDSIVKMMSLEGVDTRPVPIRACSARRAPVTIISTLTSSILVAFRNMHVDCCRENDDFLQEFTMKSRRIFHICRDLEYVAGCVDQVKDFFYYVDTAGRRPVDDWFDVLCILHGLNSHKRVSIHEPHVLYEDQRWQESIALMVELEGVSMALLTAAVSSPSLRLDANGDGGLQAQALLQIGVSAAFDHIAELYCQLGEEKIGVIFPKSDPVIYQTSFSVSTPKEISVLSPIGRFIPRLISAACNQGLQFNLRNIFDWSSLNYKSVCFMVEYALRALSFSAQVDCGMWKRNGMAVANLLYNYGRPPLCRHFRDLDICAVQVAIAWLGPELILRNMMSHFECEVFAGSKNTRRSPLTMSAQGLLLAEFLKLAILVSTYLPVNLAVEVAKTHGRSEDTKEDIAPLERADADELHEGLELALDRLVAHKVMSGSNTLSQLAVIKPLLGNGAVVGDSHLIQSVQRLCIPRPGADSTSPDGEMFNLKPESVLPFFDPECPMLSTNELQHALECMKDCMEKPAVKATLTGLGSSYGTAIPILLKTALPIPHLQMALVRRMLYSPSLLCIITGAIAACTDNTYVNTSSDNSPTEMPKSTAITVASRCVHLVTLQLHCLESCLQMNPEKHHQGNGVNYDTVSWEGVESFLSADCSHSQGLLRALAALFTSSLLSHEVTYERGLEWALLECGRISPTAKAFLITCGVDIFPENKVPSGTSASSELAAAGQEVGGSGTSGDAAEAEKKRLQERKLAARKRAIEAMQKKANDFGAMLDGMEQDDAEEEERKGGMEGERQSVVPECIICREKTRKPMGYLAHVQPSRVIYNAIVKNADDNRAGNMYVVVCRNSLPVYQKRSSAVSSESGSEELVASLRCGEVVRISDRYRNGWVKLCAPVVGWAQRYVIADSSSDGAVGTSGYVLQLYQVSRLSHARHGSVRPHVSSCGHALHFECWDTFYASSYAAHLNAAHRGTFVPYDPDKGEVLCPFCKAIANTVLPHYLCPVVPANDVVTETKHFCLPVGMSRDSLATDMFAKVTEAVLCEDTRDTTLSLREFSLAEACLTRSQLPWRQNVAPPAGFLRDPVGSTRVLHAAWSAASYTLLAMCSSDTSCSDTAERTSSGGDVDRIVVEQLICFLKCSREWVDCDTTRIANIIRKSLMQLLVPTDADIAAFKLHATGVPFLRHAPTPVVLDLHCPADHYGLVESIANEWPLLKQPLLTQDLHVLAVALTTSTSDKTVICEYIAILCLARLAQIMIEPLCTGRLDSTAIVASLRAAITVGDEAADLTKKRMRDCYEESASSTPSSSVTSLSFSNQTQMLCGGLLVFEPCALEEFRLHVCKAAGVPCHPCPTILPPAGSDLELIALDSWIPFLEFACALHSLVLSRDNTCGRFRNGCDNVRDLTARVMRMTCELGLDGIKCDHSNSRSLCTETITVNCLKPMMCPLVCDLTSAWGDMYASYYAELLVSNQDCVESAPRQAGRPRGYTRNDEDMERERVESSDDEDENAPQGQDDANGDADGDSLDLGVELEDVTIGNVVIPPPIAEGDDFGFDDDIDEDDDHDHDGGGDGGFDEEDISNMADEIMEVGEGVWPAQIANWLLQMGVPEGEAMGLMPSGREAGTEESRRPWALIGVDPDLTPYTESNVPLPRGEKRPSTAYPPLVGSVSGSCAVYSTGDAASSHVVHSQLIDTSHLGLGGRHRVGLVDLPRKFTDLYKEVKYPKYLGGHTAIDDPAICLVCGHILSAGNRQETRNRRQDAPGECTLHARECGAGTSIYFLVEKCSVLLLSGQFACFSPSLYVDAHGNSKSIGGQNKPLYLSNQRYDRVKSIHANHRTIREIVRTRAGLERVIRQSWY